MSHNSVHSVNTLRKLVNSTRFDAIICTVIVINAVILGAATFPTLDNNPTLNTLNNLCYSIFVIEFALRLAANRDRLGEFFRDGWTIADAAILLAALIPGAGPLAQIARLGRVVRLVRFLPDARVLLSGIGKALKPLASLAGLMILVIYAYAMVATELFATALPDDWGTVTRSMLTLFGLLTGENLPSYIHDGMGVHPVGAVLFFVSYALIAAFIMFNLILGIVIGSLEEARRNDRDKNEEIAALAAILEAASKAPVCLHCEREIEQAA